MPVRFRIFVSSHCAGEIRDLHQRNPELPTVLEKLKAILGEDPHNITGRRDIKKLKGVKPGQGQWRIRSGMYRLRYDIFGKDVVLYSFRHRSEAY
jgi:mRNA-degrading endonuclease RelE of RelBE toxin-antitoxin system